MWLSDTHCAKGASQFDSTNDRSYVSLGQIAGRESCVEVSPEHVMTVFYRDKYCRMGKNQYEEFSPHKPTEWEPKCLVLLIEAESRSALRDELVASGRVLSDYTRIAINYTTSRSSPPDFAVASANCALGLELKKLHEEDLAGQLARDQLLWAQGNLSYERDYLREFDAKTQGLYILAPPANPPPPPPLPPPLGGVYPPAPPSDPASVTLKERRQQLQARIASLEEEVTTRAAAITSCVPSEEVTCGRTSVLAPDPWLSKDGTPCFGYSNYEALEGAYCAYWNSEDNPSAVEAAEAYELMTPDGAPYCLSSTGTVLKCVVTADRTNRAGVYELQVRLQTRPHRAHLFIHTPLLAGMGQDRPKLLCKRHLPPDDS